MIHPSPETDVGSIDLSSYASDLSIGAVGLSMPVEGDRKQSIEQAIDFLRTQGFRVKIGNTLYSKSGYKTASAKDRAADLQEMFQDPSVNAILNLTGGFSSNEIIEHLDFNAIQSSPKWFVGYSDITAMNLALYTRARLHTVQGQMLIDHKFDRHCFHRLFPALAKGMPSFHQPEAAWDDEWEVHEEKSRKLGAIRAIPGKRTDAEGHAIAGNVSTFNLMMGTPYMPQEKNAVYFLEYDKEEKHPLPAIERYLWQLRLGNMFKDARGLVFGALEGSVLEEPRAEEELERILCEVTEGHDFPVLWNAGFGHSYPSWPIIYGQQVRIAGNAVSASKPVLSAKRPDEV
jgi:muramoyltetrapeptide carboxypeptidase